MYQAHTDRYRNMTWRRCGHSGLDLPAVSLGLWHNFGHNAREDKAREMVLTAFDLGITHLDLANNYGPPPGSAESCLGRILKQDLGAWRDELVISTKAGYTMWPGPYGDWGSRKYLVSSLEASLRRLGLDYVDIYYHHRPDSRTPLEETMAALAHLVQSGKALYAGISNYPAPLAARAIQLLGQMGCPCLIHQTRYNMLDRRAEAEGLFETLAKAGTGCIVFSPLEQGILAGRYLEGVPQDSRALASGIFLKPQQLDPQVQDRVRRLADLARDRGQTVAQLALAWALRPQGELTLADGSTRTIGATSVLVGASSAHQLTENLGALDHLDFSPGELEQIEVILAG